MTAHTPPVPVSKLRYWVGMFLSVVPGLLLLMDGVMKIAEPDFVVEATTKLGYEENVIRPLGIVLTISVLLFLVPRTAMLGAVLITGYLGGAVATHVFAKHGPFEILMPAVFGAVLWTGLALRDPRVAKLAFARD